LPIELANGGIMGERMAEIRFPLRGRSSRGDAPAATESSTDPLAQMAEQIRALDAAAEHAAASIAEAATGLANRERGGGSATRADLLAGLASALVDRTEEIRADCGRLSALMDRTAKLVADRDAGVPAGSASASPEPGAFTVGLDPEPRDDQPSLRDELKPSAGRPAPGDELEPPPESFTGVESEADKPTWLTRRDESPVGGSTSEGVRLIATQMAIAGSSRAEIEHRLRVQFGVLDADRALDEIFGVRRSGRSGVS